MSRTVAAAMDGARKGGWRVWVVALSLCLGVLQTAPALAQRPRDPAHPFTLVVLSPPLAGAAGDAARASIEQVAKARGLPVSVVPLGVTDSAGVAVADDVLLQSAHQLGGEAVLIGRADAAANGSNGGYWQLRLLTGYSAPTWSGTLEAGVQGAADAFARVSGGLAGSAVSVVVTVMGVTGLPDYARVSQLLASLPGVQSSGPVSVDGATIDFQLLVRGGAATVTGALAGSDHLAPGPTALHFQYHP